MNELAAIGMLIGFALLFVGAPAMVVYLTIQHFRKKHLRRNGVNVSDYSLIDEINDWVHANPGKALNTGGLAIVTLSLATYLSGDMRERAIVDGNATLHEDHPCWSLDLNGNTRSRPEWCASEADMSPETGIQKTKKTTNQIKSQ